LLLLVRLAYYLDLSWTLLHCSCCTELVDRSNHDRRSTTATTTTAAVTKVINRRTCTCKSQLLIGHIAEELRVVLQTTTPLEQRQATAKWNQLMISQAQALRILVMDDDPICLAILPKMLRQCSYQDGCTACFKYA